MQPIGSEAFDTEVNLKPLDGAEEHRLYLNMAYLCLHRPQVFSLALNSSSEYSVSPLCNGGRKTIPIGKRLSFENAAV